MSHVPHFNALSLASIKSKSLGNKGLCEGPAELDKKGGMFEEKKIDQNHDRKEKRRTEK